MMHKYNVNNLIYMLFQINLEVDFQSLFALTFEKKVDFLIKVFSNARRWNSQL